MMCSRCCLPDPHNGDGDGIGTCDCSRCDCCGTGPYECDCRRDFDDLYDDPAEPYDPLCNDTTCVWRIHRQQRRAEPLGEPS